MTFKIAHLSDLHLQYRSSRLTTESGINLREMDGYLSFATCVNEIINENCDAAIVAGDVFHIPNPSIRAIIFAQKQFRKLADAGVKVYILAGNHDSLDVVGDIAASKVLDDSFRGIYSGAEPYVHYEITDGINLHMCSHHLYSLQSETMSQIKPIEGELNILSTHGSVIDPHLKEKLHTDQSPREVVIPKQILTDKNWSYTFLGHIHERGFVGSKDKKNDSLKKRIYYNGSLIRRGFSDKEVPLGRGWTLWEIDENGKFTMTPKVIAQRPQIDFNVIDAENNTSTEITELIIENLKRTQTDGITFDERSAPILRQQILNITPAKFSALSWSAINQNTQHAFQWSLKKVASLSELDNPTGVLSNEEIIKSSDIVKVYDDWVKKSSTLSTVTDDLREMIETRGRQFVKQGQEASIESE